jgi:hypothetical protein
MSDVWTTPLFTLNLKPGAAQNLGRLAPILEGSFEGLKLLGSVVESGGSDWLLLRPDGATQLDVRLALTTDDGAERCRGRDQQGSVIDA